MLVWTYERNSENISLIPWHWGSTVNSNFHYNWLEKNKRLFFFFVNRGTGANKYLTVYKFTLVIFLCHFFFFTVWFSVNTWSSQTELNDKNKIIMEVLPNWHDFFCIFFGEKNKNESKMSCSILVHYLQNNSFTNRVRK